MNKFKSYCALVVLLSITAFLSTGCAIAHRGEGQPTEIRLPAPGNTNTPAVNAPNGWGNPPPPVAQQVLTKRGVPREVIEIGSGKLVVVDFLDRYGIAYPKGGKLIIISGGQTPNGYAISTENSADGINSTVIIPDIKLSRSERRVDIVAVDQALFDAWVAATPPTKK